MIPAPAAGERFGVFGASAALTVNPASALRAARALVDHELAAVDLACSRFRQDSGLSRLNGSRGAEVQVSELAPTSLDANIASTAAIVRGEVAQAWLALLGLPARLVRRDGSVATTKGWPSVPPATVAGGAVPGRTALGRTAPGRTAPGRTAPSEAA
jgi:thiamine biosynthesis lipoprotein ApbE